MQKHVPADGAKFESSETVTLLRYLTPWARKEGIARVALVVAHHVRAVTSCFTTCLLLFSESARLMKYSEILPSYYRRMRYFPLSASRLPLCKFVRASIFQRFVRENCDGENSARDFGSTTYACQAKRGGEGTFSLCDKEAERETLEMFARIRAARKSQLQFEK